MIPMSESNQTRKKTLQYILIPFLLIVFNTAGYPESDTPEEIFARESGSVVLIAAGADNNRLSIGTGFIVREDGLIATNYHIIRGSRNIGIKMKNGRTYEHVQVYKVNAARDLALLKIETSGLDPVTLGNSDRIRIGQQVLAIGNPSGLENTISDGLISAVRTTNLGVKVLQISVPVSPGSSGGPLYDMEGRVIGVTVGAMQQGQNLNFAIPANYLKYMIISLNSPADVKSSGDGKGYFTYAVKTKDTLYGIAKKFGTTVSRIKSANNLSGDKIVAGQKIKIPVK